MKTNFEYIICAIVYAVMILLTIFSFVIVLSGRADYFLVVVAGAVGVWAARRNMMDVKSNTHPDE